MEKEYLIFYGDNKTFFDSKKDLLTFIKEKCFKSYEYIIYKRLLK